MTALKKRKYKFLKEIINENISADFSHARDICKGLIKISLSKKNIDYLLNNKLAKLTISIDGATKEVFEKIRVKSNFNEI